MSDAGAARPDTQVGDDKSAAEHLLGAALPALTLESTAGSINVAELAADLLVLFIYPHATGLPDAPVLGWDLIPGAVGCRSHRGSPHAY